MCYNIRSLSFPWILDCFVNSRVPQLEIPESNWLDLLSSVRMFHPAPSNPCTLQSRAVGRSENPPLGWDRVNWSAKNWEVVCPPPRPPLQLRQPCREEGLTCLEQSAAMTLSPNAELDYLDIIEPFQYWISAFKIDQSKK